MSKLCSQKGSRAIPDFVFDLGVRRDTRAGLHCFGRRLIVYLSEFCDTYVLYTHSFGH